ncbi:PREDICTED: UDP-glycosyltransferase 91B1 [Tarenaya hassleriana]|uniref:UDP-glycosyltransferase 91B1 n=1 Tax=Tarenaya hassleriana TaxID=28532 RepID=UPI00053CA2F0|nr:PREDICTED: UDP-glycosyltransferase 91B1 [Tarenaya hassleriana]
MSEPNSKKLHVVVFPWLAFGHMIPFLELSNRIAMKGHTVSFISTPRNICRLSQIPSLSSTPVTFVALPLPPVDHLPENAEATTDLPETHVGFLKKAFDGMSEAFSEFLEASRPDWVIFDFVQHWVPPIAEKLGVSRAFFSTFNAATICIIGGPSSDMIDGRDPRKTAMDLTVPPPWVPFETHVLFRLFEARKIMEYPTAGVTGSDLNDNYRAGLACTGSDVIAIRTCMELEPEWIQLLGKLHDKPVILTGLLSAGPVDNPDDRTWQDISGWLDKQQRNSVVYVALGTEVTVTPEEIQGLAHGLELSGLPFLWALRKRTEASGQLLPHGFEERVNGQGIVWTGWVPQTKILSHGSIGGFVTHCGWGSAVEGLSFGRPLIMFPCNLDQPLVARFLAGMNVGVEIPRDEKDGSFTIGSVAETIRKVVTEEDGKIYRENAASQQKRVFGNKTLQDQYVNTFVEFLVNHRA